MLTNNFLSYLVQAFSKTSSNKPISGSVSTQYPPKGFYNLCEIKIGTGSTPAKRTDYLLESPIDSSKYTSSYTVACSTDFNVENSFLNVQCSFTNTSDDELVVSEIGAFGSSYGDRNFMYAREVLDSPVTIPVGETKSFVLKLF